MLQISLDDMFMCRNEGFPKNDSMNSFVNISLCIKRLHCK